MIYDLLMFAGRHSVSIIGSNYAFQNNLVIIPPSKMLILEPSIAQCETWEPMGNAVTFCTNFISITSGYVSQEKAMPAADALPGTSLKHGALGFL